jgi:hypothetical protein
MKRVYLLSLAIALFTVACTSKTVQDAKEQTVTENVTQEAPQEVTATDAAYETVVIKGEIKSPQKEMRTKIGSKSVTVNYGSPSVNERTVWGNLVPYDAVWRTGANEATTFETAVDLKVQGQDLPAGKYGLFTVPTESGDWTVIFNTVSEQWGSSAYDKTKDVLRVNATATMLEEASETMEFVMEGNNLVLKWDKLVLPIAISL